MAASWGSLTASWFAPDWAVFGADVYRQVLAFLESTHLVSPRSHPGLTLISRRLIPLECERGR